MEGSKLILTICRVFQLLCAAVVLGTSASLSPWISNYKDACEALYPDSECNFQGLIPAIQFGCFVGAVGLIDALAGLVSIFTDLIPYLFQVAGDALASLSYIAGGAAIAAILAKDGGCSGSRCTEIKADDAFQFLGFIVTLVIIGLSFMWKGKTGGGSSYV